MKTKLREQYRMPDGDYTTDATKMIKGWKDLYEPICEEFNMKVIGYDPDILFRTANGGCFNLPVSFCQQLKDLIKTNRENVVTISETQNNIQCMHDYIEKLFNLK